MRTYKRSKKVKSRTRSKIKSPKKNTSIGICSKWERINMHDLSMYDVTPRSCKTCHSLRLPHLVHVEFGDYVCHRCGKDVNIRTLCYNCNR